MLQLGIKGLGIARFKFNPLSWFLKGEQGAWYDPSDLTTLFQDSAGTLPIVTVGTVADQPVGLMLDKSKGLARGAELVPNGDFSNGTTGWSSGNGAVLTVVNNEAVITNNGQAYGYITVQGNLATVAGKTYKFTVTYRQGTALANSIRISATLVTGYELGYFVLSSGSQTITGYFTAVGASTYFSMLNGAGTTDVNYFDNISVKQIAGNHAFQATSANRPILSARTNILLASATLATQSVTTLATNYTLAFTGAGTVTLSGTATGTLSAGSNTFTATAGTLTLTVSGSVTLADLRPTNSGALLPPYQRVNTASDYDSVGFPLYLKCNGTSSTMSTNSIDFTATDKMTVVTGVRKLVDASYAMVMETSLIVGPANPGAFNIHAPFATSANYTTYCIGTGAAASSVMSLLNYLAPISNVLTVLDDIGTTNPNEIRLKVNGIFTGTQAGDTGSGNFGNYPLYLFSRAGTTLFLNGQFYGAIIRGAQSDTASVTQTENYMAQKTGITF